ncbi:MAG: type II toxin-antitoxin system RelE/ParE family toxin [Termitinemataceae bacterium]|nr:MAG: type II toxin-antitoxin system RelE/ParE family toxin [Termitinemataceae bacterium]
MRIFKNKWFCRFAEKARISDNDLKAIVADLENGVWDANYGGDVYKKRIARTGQGKSRGYRAIIFFKQENMIYFSYAFPKSEKSDINDKEEAKLKARAKTTLSLTDAEIQARLDEGVMIEIF